MFLSRRNVALLGGVAVLAGLYVASRYNYLLFHSIAELFSIVVACGIFMVVWNSRRFLENNYILFIGVAFLFIASIDLIHLMSYKGMSIFEDSGSNIPTQLWISARYMQSITLFAAPFFIGRRLRLENVFAAYAGVFMLLIATIFYWKVFPDCFIEGQGLTPFKKISEYVISLMLAASIYTLHIKSSSFDRKVVHLLYAAILTTVGSELAFTFYVSVYGFSNLMGHYLKIVSFFLIYKAVIETGLREPYNLLFRDLKQSEEALRRSEERYRGLSDASFEGIVVHSGGKIRDLNNAAARMFGYESPSELIGLEVLGVVSPEDREKVARKVTEGYDKLYENRGYDEPYEINCLRKDGSRFQAEAHGRTFDYKGSPGRVVAIRDITERKRVEEELRRYREHLEELVWERTTELQAVNSLLELASREYSRDSYLGEVAKLLQRWSGCRCVGIRVLDDKGNIPYGAYTGFSHEFWESENALILGRDNCACTRVIEGRPEPQDTPVMTHFGSFRVENISDFISGLPEKEKSRFRGVCAESGFSSIAIIPVRYEDSIIAAVHLADEQEGKVSRPTVEFVENLTPLMGEAIHKLDLKQRLRENYAELVSANEELEREMSERAKAEAQLLQSQKMEAVGQLAGGVAHDFNNRLFAIRNYAHILKTASSDSKSLETAEKILASCDKAAQLVDDLLKFSRKKEINPRPVDLNNIVSEAENLLRMAAGKNIEFEIRLSDGPLAVMADATQIEHVLINLVTNARDAMPDGGNLTIRTDRVGAETMSADMLSGGQRGPFAVVYISDTGPGLDDNTKEKIFEPFFTTKEIGKGTGLGLSTVYGVIKQHGGFIEVESQPGNGTTFKVYLPLI